MQELSNWSDFGNLNMNKNIKFNTFPSTRNLVDKVGGRKKHQQGMDTAKIFPISKIRIYHHHFLRRPCLDSSKPTSPSLTRCLKCIWCCSKSCTRAAAKGAAGPGRCPEGWSISPTRTGSESWGCPSLGRPFCGPQVPKEGLWKGGRGTFLPFIWVEIVIRPGAIVLNWQRAGLDQMLGRNSLLRG